MREFFDENIKIIEGGATRTLSAVNGLNAVSKQSQYAAIHDAARPFVSPELIERTFEEVAKFSSAVPIIHMTDFAYTQTIPNLFNSIKGSTGFLRSLNRNEVRCVQTPQTFKTAMIKEAYAQRNTTNNYSDDSEVWLNFFGSLHLTQGEPSNRKITFESDLLDFRVGNGFDVHKLVEGRKLVLGGVEVPHHKGLLGHSDADVVIHAIMDSLLCAVSERDIGVQFPPNDPKYKDISSLILLKQVAELLDKKQAITQNISCVIMAEQPKLANYIPEMCKTIALALNLLPSQISISATTTEELGMVGQEKAIAAQAVSLVLL